MSSLTDEISNKSIDQAMTRGPRTVETAARLTGKALKNAMKGVCLIFKGTEFTCDKFMAAVKGITNHFRDDVKYSNRNINIKDLQESGNVKMVNEGVTKEVMKYFDKYCKEYGIKYTAMEDLRDPDNPAYMVFFNGRDDTVIYHMMEKAGRDWAKDFERRENQEQDKSEPDKSHQKDKKDKENKPKRKSVRSKLAFFRNRAEFLNKERMKSDRNQNKEKVKERGENHR